jgi:hypothetical protein
MKRYFSKSTIAMFALCVAVGMAPASKAGDQPPAPPSSATSQPAAATDTQQRLTDLEKEIALLQSEIASLKEDSTAGIKTAAYAQPSAQPTATFNGPSAAGDAPPPITIASLLGGITLSGFGDFYYGYDNNHPYNNMAGLRSFEAPTNTFAFNMAEVILDKAGDTTSAENRLGYHLSAGYGEAAKLINGSDTPFTDGSNFFVKEAYASYIFPFGKGLTVMVGKFVTPMGAEVIESDANWNYSRGLLFNYAIPFFHFGANAKYAFNTKWAVTGYLVNGWNNTLIDHDQIANGTTGQSSGLTYGASLAYTPNAKWSATENYFAGPVTDGVGFNGQTLNEWKQISDTVVSYTPNMKWAFMINGDYGFGPVVYSGTGGTCDSATRPRAEGFTVSCNAGPAVDWWGVAGYAKYNWSPKTNFAVRYEYYDDPQGYTGLVFGDRGWAQEVTGTYSYNLTSALLFRGEYRYDFASEPIFDQSFSNFKSVKEQNTATVSFVYMFNSTTMK